MSTTYTHDPAFTMRSGAPRYGRPYDSSESGYGGWDDDFTPMPQRNIAAPQGVSLSKRTLAVVALTVVGAGAGLGLLAFNVAGSKPAPTGQTYVIPGYSDNPAAGQTPAATAPDVATVPVPGDTTIVNAPPSSSGPASQAPSQGTPSAPAGEPGATPVPIPIPIPVPGQDSGQNPGNGTPGNGTPGQNPGNGTPGNAPVELPDVVTAPTTPTSSPRSRRVRFRRPSRQDCSARAPSQRPAKRMHADPRSTRPAQVIPGLGCGAAITRMHSRRCMLRTTVAEYRQSIGLEALS